MTAAGVIARRRAERQRLLDLARAFARQLVPELGVRAVVVVGSVARGDFNDASDVDVVVVASRLPAAHRDRWEALGDLPAGVQPVAWTPSEWRRRRRRRDPLAAEALQAGVWVAGSPGDLGDPEVTFSGW